MAATQTLETKDASIDDAHAPARTQPVLVLAWCRSEPARIGEILIPSGERELTFGRDGAADRTRLGLQRARPGRLDATGPLCNPFVSRHQLAVRLDGDRVHVRNLGKRAIEIDGRAVASGVIRTGQTLHIRGQLVFHCVCRAPVPEPLQAGLRLPAFGEADPLGIVGESAAAWQLRDRIAFVGPRAPYALILGDSGTGKELVARALHACSPRARHALIARNAATFPAGLIDAELFGNAANYPNPGMPERPGMVGAADGSTLFLDEIGELPGELQAHLLRLLDEGASTSGSASRATAPPTSA